MDRNLEVQGEEGADRMNRKQQKEHEDRVMAQMVWILTFPGPYIPDEVSTTELVRYSEHPDPNNRVHGMTEREIRNAVRRMKRKGLIKRSWQKMNPDQPSGEYGEVWSDEPFIPHHGYTLTGAGWTSETAQEATKWVEREWSKSVREMLQEDPEPENKPEVVEWMT